MSKAKRQWLTLLLGVCICGSIAISIFATLHRDYDMIGFAIPPTLLSSGLIAYLFSEKKDEKTPPE